MVTRFFIDPQEEFSILWITSEVRVFLLFMGLWIMLLQFMNPLSRGHCKSASDFSKRRPKRKL